MKKFIKNLAVSIFIINFATVKRSFSTMVSILAL